MNVHEFAELSAGHALGALSDDDERAYLDALAAHPEWAAIGASDDETAATLAEGVAPVAPPLALRSKLLAEIAGRASDRPPLATEDAPADAAARPDETGTSMLRTAFGAAEAGGEDSPPPASGASEASASPPTDVVQAIERRNWSRGLFALVASIALLVAIGWGTGSVANIWQRPPAISALAQIEKAPDAASAQATFEGGMATLHWSSSVGEAVVVAHGLPAIDSARTFELWYIRGETAIPAGTFDASGTSTTVQLTGTMQPGDTVAVTVEPSGGSPDGKPSTSPVFAIVTA